MNEQHLINDANKREALATIRIKSWKHTANLTLDENLLDLETQSELLAQLTLIVDTVGHPNIFSLVNKVSQSTLDYCTNKSTIALIQCDKAWQKYFERLNVVAEEVLSKNAVRELTHQFLIQIGEGHARNFFKRIGWNFDEIEDELNKGNGIEFENIDDSEFTEIREHFSKSGYDPHTPKD